MAQLERATTVATTGTSREEAFRRKQHVNAYSVLVIMFITLSSAAYGYAGSVIATTLTQPSFHEHMQLGENAESNSLIGAMNSLFYVGGMMGSFFASWCSNRYGRKMAVVVGNILLVVSGALLTASVNIGMFIAFRFVSGWGAFTILSTVPVWIAELAPPKVRGMLIDIHACFMMLGYTIACYVGLGFYFVEGGNQWRGPLAVQMVLPVIILCGIHWIPESPRYLIATDRVEEARRVIKAMHSDPNDPTDEFFRREFYQIRKQIELDRTFAVSYLDILKQPSLRRRALSTILLEFSLLSGGVLVVINYGSVIWQGLGFNTLQVLNLQCGFQLTGLAFNLVAMLFVDKVQRPRLIGFGFLITSAVMATEMALQRFYSGTDDRTGLIGCAAMIFLFQVSYSLFLDGPTYFYVAEIWPSHLRSQGFSIAMATLSLTCLLWVQAAPTAFATIGWRFYLFFVCIPAIGGVIVLFWFVDTLHKPLEEIAAMFGDEDMVAVYQRELNLASIPEDDHEIEDKQTHVHVESQKSGV